MEQHLYYEHMKKILILLTALTVIISGCATVQSIIKSTFPYTATIVVPASTKSGTTISATSSATSIDEVFGNQNGSNYIKEVRIASAKMVASNPSNKSLGMFKSVKIYISGANSEREIMVASRSDIQENIGSELALDIDNSRFVDDYIKGSSLRVRLEYVLRSNTTSDVSIRTSLSFVSSPKVQE
jgi:uncharacterized protein YceK